MVGPAVPGPPGVAWTRVSQPSQGGIPSQSLQGEGQSLVLYPTSRSGIRGYTALGREFHGDTQHFPAPGGPGEIDVGLTPLEGGWNDWGVVQHSFPPDTWTWQQLSPDALKHPANFRNSGSGAREALQIFA